MPSAGIAFFGNGGNGRESCVSQTCEELLVLIVHYRTLKSKKRNIILGTMDTSTDENLPMIVAGEGAVTRSTWIPARTDRLQTRLRDAILLAIILRMLSAVLRTLTASYSSDTVMLLSSCGMVLHLIACNYMLAHQKVQLEIACNYMLAHQKVQVENSRQSENKLMAENNSLRNEIGRQRSLFEDEQKRNEEIKREKEIMAQEALKQAAELEQLQRKAEDSDERRLSAERARDMAVKESLEAKEASSKQR